MHPRYFVNFVVLSTNPPQMQNSGRCVVNPEQTVIEVLTAYINEWLVENEVDKGKWVLKNIPREDGEETFCYTLEFADGDVWYITGLVA